MQKEMVKTVDHEAKGILQYTLDELEEEIEATPQIFTKELAFYLKHYRPQMEVFVRSIKK